MSERTEMKRVVGSSESTLKNLKVKRCAKNNFLIKHYH